MEMVDEIMEAINNFECFKGIVHPFSKDYPEYKKIEAVCNKYLNKAFIAGWDASDHAFEWDTRRGKYKEWLNGGK